MMRTFLNTLVEELAKATATEMAAAWRGYVEREREATRTSRAKWEALMQQAKDGTWPPADGKPWAAPERPVIRVAKDGLQDAVERSRR